MGRSKHSGGSWQDKVRKWAYDKVGGTGQRGKQLDAMECKTGSKQCKKKD